ncbi:MAG: PucR family transcriptional regulator, partial [Myxococcales bacterium]
PERTLAGDESARQLLIDEIYQPLEAAGGSVLDTVVAYLDSGRSLEGAARTLFVHANTVRYRLKRAAELTGRDLADPRDAFSVRMAVTLGRLNVT